MSRIGTGCLSAALFAGTLVAAPAARADDDDIKTLMADCDHPDLPASDIRDCMERAREMDVSDPSPQLQRLLTQLERRSEYLEGRDAKPAPASTATSAPHDLMGATASSATPDFAVKAGRSSEKDGQRPQEIEAPDTDPGPAEVPGNAGSAPMETPHGLLR